MAGLFICARHANSIEPGALPDTRESHMNTKHTKAPWKYVINEKCTDALIVTADGSVIAELGANENTTAHRDLNENARRIVACVNSMEGYPTETIEAFSQKAQERLTGAEQQRDELLAALEAALPALIRLGDFVGNTDEGGASGIGRIERCEIISKVRSAIAKVRK